MKYTKNYIRSRDIDWFFILNGIPIHVASAGGDIPNIINDREQLRTQQKCIFDATTNVPIEFNENYLNRNFNLEQRSDYIKTFEEMSKKGFVSFDRNNIEDITNNTYHWVCRPQKIKEIKWISLYEIDTKFDIDIYTDNINLIEIINSCVTLKE